jgi:hypothetical protein
MHAILCRGFDVVKALPLHEVERAAAVEMIRYGYPFVRVHWIFDLTVRLTNRTSDPWRGFLGGIMKRPEEIAVGVDWLHHSQLGVIRAFCIPLCDVGRTLSQREEAGRMCPRCLAFLFFAVLRFLFHFLAP